MGMVYLLLFFLAAGAYTTMSRFENSVSTAARHELVWSCSPVSAPNNHA
jgi:hypothetical protein